VIRPRPFRPAKALPLPVHAAESEDRPGPAAEAGRLAGVAPFVALAEFPALDKQELEEIFAVITTEVEPTPGDDCPDESLRIVNVVKP
jgi:hypothetical protein